MPENLSGMEFSPCKEKGVDRLDFAIDRRGSGNSQNAFILNWSNGFNCCFDCFVETDSRRASLGGVLGILDRACEDRLSANRFGILLKDGQTGARLSLCFLIIGWPKNFKEWWR